MKNVLREETEEPVPEKKPRESKPARAFSRNVIRLMNLYGIFERDQVVRAFPFILFCTALLFAYIGNSYYAEGLIRDIELTKTKLKEKRTEYISTMSRLMYQSNQSEVARALAEEGIRENREAPGRIFIVEKSAR